MKAMVETDLRDAGPVLEMHDGVASMSYTQGNDARAFVRLRLGPLDASAVVKFLRLAYPDLPELGVLTCPCGAPATISRKATDGSPEDDRHWCEEHAPAGALAGVNDGRVCLEPTRDAVVFLLRHTFGFTGPGEAQDQAALHAGLISRARTELMSAQDVAEEIARLYRETCRASG